MQFASTLLYLLDSVEGRGYTVLIDLIQFPSTVSSEINTVVTTQITSASIHRRVCSQQGPNLCRLRRLWCRFSFGDYCSHYTCIITAVRSDRCVCLLAVCCQNRSATDHRVTSQLTRGLRRYNTIESCGHLRRTRPPN